MRKELSILCVEDVPADVARVNHALREGGMSFRSTRVETQEAFVRELEHNPPDVILSDHGLPSFDGFMALTLAQQKCPEVPFIFVTGKLGEQVAIETLRNGATDYVLKSNLTKLAPTIERALREAEERAALKQEGLRESEVCYGMLVENVTDCAIYMLDPMGRVSTWNAGAERLEGYSAEEIIGNPLAMFFTPEDVQRRVPEQLLLRAEKEGQVLYGGQSVRKNGSRFWVEGTLKALRDEDGKVRGYCKLARDITRSKEAAEEIRQLSERLEKPATENIARLEAGKLRCTL